MQIEMAGASVRGKDHIIAGKNNQDAFIIKKTPTVTAAVVCDGCGSGSNSEVGAKLAAEFLANYLIQNCWFAIDAEDFVTDLAEARLALEDYLLDIVECYDERLPEIVNSSLLFTTLGVVINSEYAVFFALGDGYFNINGEPDKIGPFKNNAPPYLGYNLVTQDRELDFQIVKIIRTSELKSFVIATDGVEELINSEGQPLNNIPTKVVPAISEFYEQDCYFTNSQALSRKLNLIAGGVPKVINVNGTSYLATGNSPLRDDTTLIVGRAQNVEQS